MLARCSSRLCATGRIIFRCMKPIVASCLRPTILSTPWSLRRRAGIRSLERLAALQSRLVATQAGRFEDALATFTQADRYDTPDVSRWTWLLGAGWASMLMGRDKRRIATLAADGLDRAINAGAAGRVAFSAGIAAYQRLGAPMRPRQRSRQTLALRPTQPRATLRRRKRTPARVICESAAADHPAQVLQPDCRKRRPTS